MALKYFKHLVFGVNHIFKTEGEDTPLCGVKRYGNTEWASAPAEVEGRETCKNCREMKSGDHPFLNKKRSSHNSPSDAILQP